MKKQTLIIACVIVASIALNAILSGLQGVRQQSRNLPDKTMAVQIPPRVGSNSQDWNITWGGSKLDEGYVTLDPTGQFLYMAGETNAVLGDHTKGDACLVKFSINGTQLWNQTWGNPSWADYAESHPAVDASGNIYLAGRTENNVVAQSAFLLKYAPDGTLLWADTYGTGSLPSEATDVTVDSSGFVYIAGLTQLVLGDYQALIVKFYPNGTQIWNTNWGGPGTYPAGCEYVTGISVDNSNNLYICGLTNSYGAGGYDGFVSKYNAMTSALIWNKTWGGTGDDEFCRCGLGPDGLLYVVGLTNSFGAGGYDGVIVKYDTNGNQVWNRTCGGILDEQLRELCFDAQNNIYVSGTTNSFGAGGLDIYFLKYDSTGNLLWNRTWGGPLDEGIGTIQIDANHNIYLGGYTYNWGAGNGDAFIAYIHDTPAITAPSTLSYPYGISGNNISWSINDYITNSPTYSVYHNSTLWGAAGQSWTSNLPFATNIDGLSIGDHNFTLIAQDGTGLSGQATVLVTVLAHAPVISGQTNANFTYGIAQFNVSWTITDLATSTATYTIFHNGSTYGQPSQPWVSGQVVSVDISGFVTGFHNITIVANDGCGFISQAMVLVTVYNAPLLVGPTTASYLYGTSSHSLTWNIIDNITTTPTYTIYNNGSVWGPSNVPWVNDTNISVNVDGLQGGYYNFTIIANDGMGNISTATAILTVNRAPIFSGAGPMNFIYGTTNNVITWILFGNATTNPTFTAYKNGSIWGTPNQQWVNNQTCALSADGLNLGYYNITIVASDGYGYTSSQQVTVSMLYAMTNGTWQNIAMGSQILLCAQNLTEYAELLVEGTASGAQMKITTQYANPSAITLAGSLVFFSIELNGLDKVKFPVTAQFFYDPSQLPSGVDASRLQVYHFENGAWVEVAGVLNPNSHSITVNCPSFSVYAIAVRPSGQPNLTFDPVLWGSIGICGIVIVVIVLVVKRGKGKKSKKENDNLFDIWD
ncbi:MAG TPA: hypothetical protein VKK79_02250 [Candidatus Lokiarchaeia archaeon]|nr:hypothetical protein [Candidatus Lokiarchaeia archaeon]